MYAATHDEGLLASRTLGRTCVPLNHGLPIRKVWSVAVHPENPDDLWAGTHFSYLFRSADRGRTWSLVEGYLKAPGSEHRYGDWGFGTAGEIYASADVGDTWRLLAAGLPRVQGITVAVA